MSSASACTSGMVIINSVPSGILSGPFQSLTSIWGDHASPLRALPPVMHDKTLFKVDTSVACARVIFVAVTYSGIDINITQGWRVFLR